MENKNMQGSDLYAEHSGRFARMIDENPDKALEEYGFTFIHSVDESDSASFLKRLKLAPESWRQGFLESVALHRRGKLDDAEKRYKELLSQAANHKEIEYNLAALYLQKGDAGEATKRLKNFESYLDSLKETNSYVEDCRERVKDMREELRAL